MWTNPRAVGPYDLIVVGGDALAVLAAEFAGARGTRVALASDHPLGLDAECFAPRAALALAAKSLRAVRAASGCGWPGATSGAFDFEAWRQASDRLARNAASRFCAERLQARGVDVHLGPLTFQSAQSLRVAGQSLSFARAFVAPHADWAPPTIPGLAELDYRTPDNLGSLTCWPRHWAIVGAGVVACEMAQALAALGSTVDLIAPGGLLADLDLEIGGQESAVGKASGIGQASVGGQESIGALVAQRLTAHGVRLWLDCNVAEAAAAGAAKSLLVEQRGKRQMIVADEILVVTHRRLDIEWLRLDLAGVKTDGGDIAADRQLRTANSRIAAAPARELPELSDREAVAVLARLAADAGLGINDRATPVLAPRRMQFDPPIVWIGDCGSARGETVDICVTLTAEARWWNSDLRAEVGKSPVEESRVGQDALNTSAAEASVEAKRDLSAAGEDAMKIDPLARGVRQELGPDAGSAACELRLRIDSSRQRLLGAIVVGADAQWLVAPLTQMIVAGPRGADCIANRPELEWLARLIFGPQAGAGRRAAWWRRIWRARDDRPGA